MNVKPKFVYYDIRRKQSVSLIMYTHENDVDTQVLEISMLDNGEPIELSVDYTYTAAIVNRETKALINDNISCELNDSGNVLIPIDNFHTLGAQDLLIELTITDSAGNQVLVTPFPLWIHVNASILNDAQVTPESQGTVPELLEDAEKALEDAQQAIEDAGDYDNLTHKPQINGHELVGNKTGDELGLQGKLTAGENITINENDGTISAEGGVTSYVDLDNKPRINGVELIGNKTSGDLDLNNYVDLIGKPIINGSIVSGNLSAGAYDLASAHYLTNREIEDEFINSSKVDSTTMYLGYINFTNLPEGSALTERGQVWSYRVYEWEGYARDEYVQYGFSTKGKLYCRTGEQRVRHGQGEQPIEWNDWIELNQSIFSATVNQNGTITFTMSDGSTVTTTGESVIGPQGDDYVMTNQDKTDIANIVLSELPTTQGVQYGNTSN